MEFTHAFYDALPPEAAAIRQAVFVEEQGFQEEFDAIDRHALHLLLFADGRPVGTLRAFTEDGRHPLAYWPGGGDPVRPPAALRAANDGLGRGGTAPPGRCGH